MKTIQEIRVVLDARAKDITKLGKTRELALALTTLEQGRMLLGKTLGKRAETSPYPEADNANNRIVSPAADTAAGYVPVFTGDPITDVKQVRVSLEEVCVRLEQLRRELWARDYGTVAEVMFNAALVEITLCKMWLGMQLARAAEEAKKPRVPVTVPSEESKAADQIPPAAPVVAVVGS